MPHPVALSVAYLSIFDCAATNALNSWHASFGVALRSPAALIAIAFFFASSRSLLKSFMPGGSCCGAAGPNCACALPAKSATTHMTGNARRKRMKPDPLSRPIITVEMGGIVLAYNNRNASGRRRKGLAEPRAVLPERLKPGHRL